MTLWAEALVGGAGLGDLRRVLVVTLHTWALVGGAAIGDLRKRLQW